MSRNRLTLFSWIGIFMALVMGACGIFSTSPGTSSPSNSGPSSSSSTEPSSSGPSQPFPLTPNPVNVKITLDTAHKISSQFGLSGNLANGGDFNLTPSNDGLITQDSSGDYALANGTSLTATPVSAISGIPFAKGYLAAIQFGPEGMLMVTPATVEMKFPGSYTDLVGFAANGDGTDFHLYPIDASVSGGYTWITFNVMHFSMFGVAEATQAEITAQQAHPPADPGSQDDELLAAPQSVKQQQLSQQHDRLLKKLLTNLNACNNVVQAARNFFKWYGNVQSAGQQNYFKSVIDADSKLLTARLKDCLQISCPLCMANQKASKKSANTLIVQSTYIQLFYQMQGDSTNANYYRELGNKCATNAGLPLPSPHVAECQGSQCGAVPTEVACPTVQ